MLSPLSQVLACLCVCVRACVFVRKLHAQTHIDNLQLPQGLDTLQCPVPAGQEVVQVLLQTQAVQPGGQGRAAVTAQRLHLQGHGRSVGRTMRTGHVLGPVLKHKWCDVMIFWWMQNYWSPSLSLSEYFIERERERNIYILFSFY